MPKVSVSANISHLSSLRFVADFSGSTSKRDFLFALEAGVEELSLASELWPFSSLPLSSLMVIGVESLVGGA